MTESFDPQQLQHRLLAMQEEIMAAELSGSSPGGEVAVTGDGVGRVSAVRIDPALDRDDLGRLQDLIVAALDDLADRREALAAAKTSALSGGFAAPTFDFGDDAAVPRTSDGLIDLG
ncbi:YbaB/EbfC family nucleoid-associated protein [Gordonia phosphorivorans]|uniref:YbaB/EbfC family nucleoid-associated protein n=1 Tax=Gordonia phosphorivorans TaxID=1056982 RepID=A0ABV6H4B2_9ACTN